MASRRISYQTSLETAAPEGRAASMMRKLTAFARARRAYRVWHDIRVLESRAGQHAGAAAESFSISTWFNGVAARAACAMAEEARIRRDTRELMAMSDHMLKDIGLTRAEIGRAVRYGRN